MGDPEAHKGYGTPIPTEEPPVGGPVECETYRELLRPSYADIGCFPLHRYTELMGHDPFAFFGITDVATELKACDTIWDCSERLRLARAVQQAQEMIELELGYPLCRKFKEDWLPSNGNLYRYRIEQFKLNWGYVQSIGVPATADVHLSVTVNYGAGDRDDATLTLAANDYPTGDLAELCLFEEDTDNRIWPSSVIRAADYTITITVPKSRLVKRANECDSEILITDDDKFVEAIDVLRCYMDTTEGVKIIRDPTASDLCDSAACQSTYVTGCGTIVDSRPSMVKVQPGSYDDDAAAWVGAMLAKAPSRVYVPYWAGYHADGSPYRWNYGCSDGRIWESAELVVIWLALTLLPSPPCGCMAVRDYYEQNLKPAPVFSRTELVPPWGGASGAWKAWQFVQRFALGRGGLAFYGFGT